MTDIVIIQRRDRAYVIGETPKAKEWIAKNIVTTLTANTYSIPSELVEDLIEDFKEAELIVEVK